jgi:hypothetical protein
VSPLPPLPLTDARWCLLPQGDQILQSYGFDSFTVSTSMLMLLLLAAVYTVLSYYAMVSNDQSKMLVLEFSHQTPEDEKVKIQPGNAKDKDKADEKRPLKGDGGAAVSMTPRGSSQLMATFTSSQSSVPQYLQVLTPHPNPNPSAMVESELDEESRVGCA